MAKEKKAAAATVVKIGAAKQQRLDVKRTKSGIVLIPGIATEKFKTLLIGETTLMCHKFAEKLRKQILDKHMGEASAGRERKDPEANFEAARYRLADGSDGIPAGGIKACFVKGFIKASGVPMTKAKGAIRVVADDPVSNLVRIIGPKPRDLAEGERWPTIENDGAGGIVRNQSGVVDIRHRPVYWPWALAVEVEYLPSIASMAQVLQAIATAGFIEGLCEWRPGSKESLSGSFGTFRLATSLEAEAFESGELFKAMAAPNGRRKRAA